MPMAAMRLTSSWNWCRARLRMPVHFLSIRLIRRLALKGFAISSKGFESSFGLELLTTVHWVVGEEGARTLDGVVERTYAWNERKKQFSRRQIKIAFDVLSKKGWIEHLDLCGTAHLHDAVSDSPEEDNDKGCNP